MRARRKKHLDERASLVDDIVIMAKTTELLGLPESERYDLIDYNLVFKNDNPVELEIGCGKGRFINEKTVADGLSFTFDGVRFDILQTQSAEDDQINGNSLVIRTYIENADSKTCLFLNDTSIVSGARLLKTYGASLKSDIVQMAHHGQAGADKDVYDTIAADVRLWPIPFWVWLNEETYKVGEVRAWVGVDKDNVTKNDVVSCLYERYPEDYASVEDWKKCVDCMKVVLDK